VSAWPGPNSQESSLAGLCHLITSWLDESKPKVGQHFRRHPLYNELQGACKNLSAATQVVDNLKKDLVEEQQRRGAAERAMERAASRLTDLRRALASGSGSEAVASLKLEAAKLRDLVNTSLPKYASLLMQSIRACSNACLFAKTRCDRIFYLVIEHFQIVSCWSESLERIPVHHCKHKKVLRIIPSFSKSGFHQIQLRHRVPYH
jgi:hypothetical protein